jgi:hypothetical protein
MSGVNVVEEKVSREGIFAPIDKDCLLVEPLADFDGDEWDKRLCQVEDGTSRQSSYYAGYKERYYGEKPVYLVARDGDGRIVGQLLFFFTHPYGWGIHRRGWSFLTPVLETLLPSFYWFDGPVVFDRDRFAIISEALIKWVMDAAQRRGCISGRAIPSIYASDYEDQRAILGDVFARAGFAANPHATLVVDLTQDEDELFANLKREARNKVRKAQRQGVEIAAVGNDSEGLAMYHHVMEETARRNGLPAISLKNMRDTSWSYYYPHGVSKGFVSSLEGQLVSSQQAVIFNGIMLLGSVSYTDYSREKSIYGNDLMQWHLIKWGRENGMRSLDFAGIAPHSQSPKMKAILDFKSKWGGRRIDFCDYVVAFDNPRAYAHKLLTRTLGSIIKNIERKMRKI